MKKFSFAQRSENKGWVMSLLTGGKAVKDNCWKLQSVPYPLWWAAKLHKKIRTAHAIRQRVQSRDGKCRGEMQAVNSIAEAHALRPVQVAKILQNNRRC